MTIGLPITDFIALCVVTAEYNLDISIDDLILQAERDKDTGLREYHLDPNRFSDYFFLIATRLGYINYPDWNQISKALYHIPKLHSVFTDMTFREWISPMLSLTWMWANDSEDDIYTLKNAIDDEYYSDKSCREYYMRFYPDWVIEDGCRFNMKFRELLKNSETLTSSTLKKFFEYDNFTRNIVQIYTRQLAF